MAHNHPHHINPSAFQTGRKIETPTMDESTPIDSTDSSLDGCEGRGRTTISEGPSINRLSKPPAKSRVLQCTHTTMVSMYTNMRCSSCGKVPSSGWLYRCTQDRVLMLEEKPSRITVMAFDDLYKAIGIPTDPRRGSPAARAREFSVWNELTPEQYSTYAPDQMNQVCIARMMAQHKAKQQTAVEQFNKLRIRHALNPKTDLMPKPEDIQLSDTPWVVPPGDECQYKVCHSCRPSCADRTHLSLDAVVKGEVPVTALTGFGFNPQLKRPIMLKKHAMNFGMRDNPPTKPDTPASPWLYTSILNPGQPLPDGHDIYSPLSPPSRPPSRAPCRASSLPVPSSPPSRSNSVSAPPRRAPNPHGRKITPPSREPTPFDDLDGADYTFGDDLGASAYDSSAMVRFFNIENPRARAAKMKPVTGDQRRRLRSTLAGSKNAENVAWGRLQRSEKGDLEEAKQELKALFAQKGGIENPFATPKKLEDSQSIFSPISSPIRGTSRHRSYANFHSLNNTNGSPKSQDMAGDLKENSPGDLPLPFSSARPHSMPLSAADVKILRSSLMPEISTLLQTGDHETTMEVHEREDHMFGAEPLAVDHGVAFTEEAVELHVPDIITQL